MIVKDVEFVSIHLVADVSDMEGLSPVARPGYCTQILQDLNGSETRPRRSQPCCQSSRHLSRPTNLAVADPQQQQLSKRRTHGVTGYR